MEEREVAERVRRVEALLEVADERAVELAGALLELYGEALSRVMATVSAVSAPLPVPGSPVSAPGAASVSAVSASGAVEGLVERVAADELVSHLLLLHGLHPVEARVRVERAAARAAGAAAEVVEVGPGVARVRLRRAAKGCGSSRGALGSALEAAVRDAAPEIERVEIEVVDSAPPAVVIPVEELFRAPVRGPSGMPA
ncbi:NifU family protein [Nonomuraea glycinis]|uniref:NifU family protein n=1 Tax=Nonomuraea glycinis TaxID=2047744 RepID=UPI0033A45A90